VTVIQCLQFTAQQVAGMASVANPSGGNSNVKRGRLDPYTMVMRGFPDAVPAHPLDGSARIGPKPSLFDPHCSETQ
jgi:hypothetical protein